MPENTNKDKLSNYSIDFSSTDYINFDSFPDIAENNCYSFSFWFKTTSISNAQIICAAAQTNLFDLRTRFSSLQVIDATASRVSSTQQLQTNVAAVTNNVRDGEWHHIAFIANTQTNDPTISNDYVANLYLDGYRATQAAFATPTTLAGVMASTLRLNNSFTGQISQFCFFNRVLSDGGINQYELAGGEVAQLYNLTNPMIFNAPPVVYTPLGDNSNPNASAGYPNTSVGADSVFDFDRSTQDEILIDENNNKLFQGVSAFTVSAWVKLKTNTGYDHGVVGNDGVSTRGFYMTMKNSPQLRFFVSTTGTTSDAFTYTNPTSTLNRWVHYVVIWDGSNMDMYVDGMYSQTQACVNATGTFTAPVGTVIGGPLGQGGDNKYYFDGEISNVQIWYQRLSHGTASVGDVAGGDIATLYNNGQPLMTGTQPEAANLKAWYKLNQSANWEADTTGNWQIPDATSAFPQSFNFIAANSDYIDAGDQDELKNITKLSVSLWFNYDSILTSADGLVARDSSTRVDGNWYVSLDFNNSIRFLLKTANGQDALNSSTISANKWYHTLCVWTGDVMKIYLNGDLDNSITLSNATGTLGSASDIVAIGRRFAGGGFLNGKASNVALWSSDQSLQVSNIYNNGTPATSYTNTPQYWYKLDNTSVWNPAPANYWTFPNAGEQDNSGIFNFSN